MGGDAGSARVASCSEEGRAAVDSGRSPGNWIGSQGIADESSGRGMCSDETAH